LESSEERTVDARHLARLIVSIIYTEPCLNLRIGV